MKTLKPEELANLIGRTPSTIRRWENTGILPAELTAKRDEHNERYWTEAQAFEIAVWMGKSGRGRASRARRRISNDVLDLATKMARAGRKLDYIARVLLPYSRYASQRRFEDVLAEELALAGYKVPSLSQEALAERERTLRENHEISQRVQNEIRKFNKQLQE